MALLAAVLAMLVLGFLGTTFASLVVQHQYAAVNQSLALHALYLAEAGFELAVQEVLDNEDKAFNGATADGVIGQITNVPLGSGKVSVAKGTQQPPVFTATGTVGTVSRVIEMAIDINLVKLDPVFQDAPNLATNWPEAPPAPGEGASGIDSTANSCCSPSALTVATWLGPNFRFSSYREQTLSPTIPPGSRIPQVRLNYMRDRIGPSANIDRFMLELQLVRSNGTTEIVFSTGFTLPDVDDGVWKLADIRGWTTSATLTTSKVRLFYDLRTTEFADPTDRAIGWFDNIVVNLVKKSAWSEP